MPPSGAAGLKRDQAPVRGERRVHIVSGMSGQATRRAIRNLLNPDVEVVLRRCDRTHTRGSVHRAKLQDSRSSPHPTSDASSGALARGGVVQAGSTTTRPPRLFRLRDQHGEERISQRVPLSAGRDDTRTASCGAGSSRTSSSATFISAIDCQRRSGSFRKHRAMTFSRSRGTLGSDRSAASGLSPGSRRSWTSSSRRQMLDAR